MSSSRLGFFNGLMPAHANPYLEDDYQLAIHRCIQPWDESGNTIVVMVALTRTSTVAPGQMPSVI